MVLLEANEVSFAYGTVKVFEGMNVQIGEKEFIGVYGENGSGKSTLLSLFMGDIRPDAGVIRLYAQKILFLRQNDRDIAAGSVLSVIEFLLMHKMKYHVLKGKKNRMKEVGELLDTFGLRSIERQQLRTLSGGQLQRVLLVRLFMELPQILLLDEPLNGLDEESQEAVMELLVHLKEKGCAVVLVLHDRKLLEKICDRVVICAQHRLEGGDMHV